MKNKNDQMGKRLPLFAFIVCMILFISSMPHVVPDDDEGDLILTKTEVIQVIEDPKALIVNKSAAIRVSINSTFPERVYTKVNVTYNFGDNWYIEDGYDGNGIPIDPGENIVYVPGGPAFPGQEEPWIDPESPPFFTWDRTGFDAGIYGSVDPFDEIAELNELNNECGTDKYVTVSEAETQRILFVPIVFNDPDAVSWTINDTAMEESYKFMLSTYPLAPENLVFEERSTWYCRHAPVYEPGTIKMDKDWLYEYVAHPLSREARLAGYDRVVIAIDEHFGPLGVAIGMFREPEDRLPVLCRSHFSTFPGGRQELKESLVAHELGHTYYLWHPHDIGPYEFNSKKFNVETREYAGRYDLLPTFMSYRREPFWIDKDRYDSFDKTWYPPGEYHFPGDPQGWASAYDDELPVGTWGWNLFDQFTGYGVFMMVATVSGILDSTSGEIFTEAPWYVFYGNPDTLQPPQEPTHFIRLIGQNTFKSIPIRMSYDYVSQIGMFGELKPATTDRIPFCFNIPLTPDTETIQILDQYENILVERIMTSHAPSVDIQTPNGGETIIVGDSFEISWAASDSDGDDLTYMMLYSINNGETWIPIISEISETVHNWDTSYLEPRQTYLIKIIACDGMNTGSDISDAFFTLEENLVSVDIKPGSCPNPLNRKSKGVLPIAICGNEEFDVMNIDPGSLRLMRDGSSGFVRPIRWNYEDVATPYLGEDGDCHDLNEDGYLDITLKFKIQEIVSNLDLNSSAKGVIPLSLFGNLKEEYGGTSLQGQDYIWINQ